MAWKSLCEKHAYRRLSDEQREAENNSFSQPNVPTVQTPGASPYNNPVGFNSFRSATSANQLTIPGASSSAPDLRTKSLDRLGTPRVTKRRPKAMSYRSHFKQRYMVETAWRQGGKVDQRQITPDQGVVTSLHLTEKYIVVALDNAKIHVFDTDGCHQKTLQGHVMGVWAMVPWGDLLVSGGCDREVRVWNMATG